MKIEEIKQAARVHTRKFLDKNDVIEAAFIAGATWANDENRKEIYELVSSLRMLNDKIANAPAGHRLSQLEIAMLEIEDALKRHEQNAE